MGSGRSVRSEGGNNRGYCYGRARMTENGKSSSGVITVSRGKLVDAGPWEGDDSRREECV